MSQSLFVRSLSHLDVPEQNAACHPQQACRLANTMMLSRSLSLSLAYIRLVHLPAAASPRKLALALHARLQDHGFVWCYTGEQAHHGGPALPLPGNSVCAGICGHQHLQLPSSEGAAAVPCNAVCVVAVLLDTDHADGAVSGAVNATGQHRVPAPVRCAAVAAAAAAAATMVAAAAARGLGGVLTCVTAGFTALHCDTAACIINGLSCWEGLSCQ